MYLIWYGLYVTPARARGVLHDGALFGMTEVFSRVRVLLNENYDKRKPDWLLPRAVAAKASRYGVIPYTVMLQRHTHTRRIRSGFAP